MIKKANDISTSLTPAEADRSELITDSNAGDGYNIPTLVNR